MKRKILLFLLAVILIPLSALRASPVEVTRHVSGGTSVRSDVDMNLRLVGGKGSVFREGRDINLTFRTSRDAYVIIYNIGTDGFVQLLYPADGRLKKSSGNEVHFLPNSREGVYWKVSGETGIEYIHAIAVTNGDRIDLDELSYLAQNPRLESSEQLRIDMDPFLAFNMIDENLIGGIEDYGIATDFSYFYVNREVDYPRYLCSKCHGEDSGYDPYEDECPEIVIERAIDGDRYSYPYPALYSVSHVNGEDDEYYSSTYYADNLTDSWDDWDYDDSDEKVYLSVYYTNYDYPYRFYYPYYRTWYMSYYDPWDWGFSFNWHWGDYYYHHYPFNSWYGYRYDWYRWNCMYGYDYAYHDWWHMNSHHYPYGSYHNYAYYPKKRSIYASRSFTRRSPINYALASTRKTQKKVLSRSRLTENRAARRTEKILDRSRLSRMRDPVTSTSRTAESRSTRSSARTRDTRREVIYGNSRTSRGSTTTRSTSRTRSSTGSRTSDRPSVDRGVQQKARDRSRSSEKSTRTRSWRSKRSSATKASSSSRERRSEPAAKSRTRTRSSGSDTKARSSRSSTSSSSKAKSSRSSRSSRSKSSSVKRSSSSKSSPPARSTSRSSTSGSRSSSRSSSSSSKSSSGKSRRR